MNTRTLLLASLAPAFLLAGCMGTQNRGLESVHQPVVSRSDYAIDLATAGGALAAGERERLAGWMEAMRLGFGDQVSIDDPSGAKSVAAAQVAGVTASFGLLLGEPAAISSAPVAPGTIRVLVSRERASVPGCPDYSRDSSHEFDSNTSSNYGCATNRNLAAMVARPTDLVAGRASDGVLAPVRASKSVEAYRKAPAITGVK